MHIKYLLKDVYGKCKGGFACTGMIAGIDQIQNLKFGGFGLFAFRDPNGIRPLVYGKRSTEIGIDYCVTSESVALEALGFTECTNVNPGEAIIFTRNGVYKRQCIEDVRLLPCMFEFVYLARPDSIIDGISVYKARVKKCKLNSINL